LGPLLIGLGATFLLNVILASIQKLALLRIELRLALEQSARFVWHVLRLPIEFFGQRFAGDLASRVEANDRVATLIANDFGNAATNIITATFLAAAMTFYNVTLAAIAIGGAIINILAMRLASRPLKDTSMRVQTEVSKWYSASIVGLQSIETLKATGSEAD